MSITTLSITSFMIATFSITSFMIATFSIIPFSIATLSIRTTQHSNIQQCATLSIMALSIAIKMGHPA
jgi:hypothetical protein